MNKIIILLLYFFCNSIFVFAQDTTNTSNSESARGFLSDDENWTIEVPIWIPGFRGNFVYGDVSLEGEDGAYPPIDNPIEPEPEPPHYYQ